MRSTPSWLMASPERVVTEALDAVRAGRVQVTPTIPYKVAINEAVELAKSFGGTDGHKYVNAVLNGLAPKLRAVEVAADKAAGAGAA